MTIFENAVGSGRLKYLRSYIHDTTVPLILTSIRVDPGARVVRSHFERLSVAEIGAGRSSGVAKEASEDVIPTSAPVANADSAQVKTVSESSSKSVLPTPSGSAVPLCPGPCDAALPRETRRSFFLLPAC